jgi:hypothetical protein
MQWHELLHVICFKQLDKMIKQSLFLEIHPGSPPTQQIEFE